MKEIESGPNGESAVADIFNELSFKCFNFGLMLKSDTYNDETRKKVRVFRADPVNYATECKELTEAIAQYNIA